jgi:hypothetical protein
MTESERNELADKLISIIEKSTNHVTAAMAAGGADPAKADFYLREALRELNGALEASKAASGS